MNSKENTSPTKQPPAILITDEKENEDGSVSVNYVLNNFALETCAKHHEKNIEDLTEEEIHDFVLTNIGSALLCRNGWRMIKEVEK
jgi:hypothetical protein